MDKPAAGSGQMKAIEVGHIDFDTDGQIVLSAEEVGEVDPSFVRMARAVHYRTGLKSVPINQKFHAACGLCTETSVVDFNGRELRIDCVAN